MIIHKWIWDSIWKVTFTSLPIWHVSTTKPSLNPTPNPRLAADQMLGVKMFMPGFKVAQLAGSAISLPFSRSLSPSPLALALSQEEFGAGALRRSRFRIQANLFMCTMARNWSIYHCSRFKEQLSFCPVPDYCCPDNLALKNITNFWNVTCVLTNRLSLLLVYYSDRALFYPLLC